MAETVTALLAEKVLGVTIATWITTAMIVHGAIQARKQRNDLNAALANMQRKNFGDQAISYRSTDAPRNMVYGKARVGGLFTWGATHGDLDEFFTSIWTVASTEITAIDDILANNVSIGPLDGNGYVQAGSKYWKSIGGVKTIEYERPGGGAWTAGDKIPTPGNTRILSVIEVDLSTNDTVNYWQVAGAVAVLGNLQVQRTLVGDVMHVELGTGGTINTKMVINYGYDAGRPLLRVRKFLGNPAGERDLDLEAAFPSQWTATHLGKDQARVKITTEYDPSVFGTNGMPDWSFIVRGRKCYNPATEVTEYTENVALHTLDFILHQKYGLGCDYATEISEDHILAAIADCDDDVDLGVGDETQKRYFGGGVVYTDSDPRANLEKILSGMLGTASWINGRWEIRAGVGEVPVHGLYDTDRAQGEVTVTGELRRLDLFNGVRGRFIDAANFYKSNPFPSYLNESYADADNEEIFKDMDLEWTQDGILAQRIAKALTLRARQALTITAPFMMTAYERMPGQMVYLGLSRFGWHTMNSGNGKAFRILKRTLSLDGRIMLTCQEEVPSWADWLSSEGAALDPAPNTDFPDPSVVSMVDNVRMKSGADYTRPMPDGSVWAYILVEWDQFVESAVLYGGYIEWAWKDARSGATAWVPVRVDRLQERTQVEIGPVYSGQVIVLTAIVHSSNGAESRLFAATYTVDASVPAGVALSTSPNLLSNPGWAFNTKGWTEYRAEPNSALWNRWSLHKSGIQGNPRSMLLYQSGADQSNYQLYSDPITVRPGQRYSVRCKGVGHRSDFFAVALVYDSSNNIIAAPYANLAPGSVPGIDPTKEDNYIYSELFVDIPANGVNMRISHVKNPTYVGQPDSGVFFFKPQIALVAPGQTVHPEWDSGIQGIVDTDQLEIGAVRDVRVFDRAWMVAAASYNIPALTFPYDIPGPAGYALLYSNILAAAYTPGGVEKGKFGPFQYPVKITIEAQATVEYYPVVPFNSNGFIYGPWIFADVTNGPSLEKAYGYSPAYTGPAGQLPNNAAAPYSQTLRLSKTIELQPGFTSGQTVGVANNSGMNAVKIKDASVVVTIEKKA